MNKKQLETIIKLVIEKHTDIEEAYPGTCGKDKEYCDELEELKKDLTETLYMFLKRDEEEKEN